MKDLTFRIYQIQFQKKKTVIKELGKMIVQERIDDEKITRDEILDRKYGKKLYCEQQP